VVEKVLKTGFMIYYDKVTKFYDGQHAAVEAITLGIEPGEFVSIVGHSGAGKTTLLKLLFAEIFPTEGSVFFGQREIGDLSGRELLEMRRNIGTIFQDFRLLPTKNLLFIRIQGHIFRYCNGSVVIL
jgi:cell division transport system ATP-binding protein